MLRRDPNTTMIPTFVIGLREGLEAALIVGIIAAFLRRNGRSRVPMWIGVGAAIALSVAVGVALRLVEQALPQAAQEGLESVIGAVAVVFVTGMIVWMSGHARAMRTELEGDAGAALGRGGAGALAVMAFLAVLKEGFETSVFLLATFSAAQSAALAALGAIAGILLAAVIGVAISFGGARVNLGRFFQVTGGFLVLVAAGLVVTTLRTAHEAGWLLAGQQQTVDLSWLVAPGTVQSALLTGVLGVPSDPRLIEVVGWVAYLVPVTAFVFWPRAHRPRGLAVPRMQFGLAAALLAVGGTLALALPAPSSPGVARVSLGGGAQLRLLDRDGRASAVELTRAGGATERIPLDPASGHGSEVDGVSATRWSISTVAAPGDASASLSLNELVAAAGGRVPIGVDAAQSPGPFSSVWSTRTTTTVWLSGDSILNAQRSQRTLIQLSGGGLRSPRTVTVASDGDWQVPAETVAATIGAIAAADAATVEHRLWARWLPGAIALAAIACAVAGARRLAAERSSPDPQLPATPPSTRSTSYAATP